MDSYSIRFLYTWYLPSDSPANLTPGPRLLILVKENLNSSSYQYNKVFLIGSNAIFVGVTDSYTTISWYKFLAV